MSHGSIDFSKSLDKFSLQFGFEKVVQEAELTKIWMAAT